MKKFFSYVVLGAVCCLGVVACSNGDDPVTPPSGELELTISSATSTVGQSVTFKVMNNGTDVTSKSKVQCAEEGKTYNVPAVISWAAGKAGTYNFTATYEGATSAAKSVVVTGQNLPANFKRRVLVIDFTGSQCSPCVPMTTMLDGYMRTYPDAIVLIAAHLNVPGPDILTTDQTIELAQICGVTGTPTLWIDCRQKLGSPSMTVLNTIVKNSNDNFGAICGIGIKSTVSGNKVTAEVEVPIVQTSQYKICAVLVEDGMVAGGYQDFYNHVARKYATNVVGDDLNWKLAGEKYTGTFEFTALAGADLEKSHVVVYVYNWNNGSFYVNNINTCAVNGSVASDK